MAQIRKHNHAFSLVELSIVLVILGLLVGGILAGQSLIRASELRSIGTDISKYRTAMLTFRDKYFYWPGDMPNATAVWGIAAGATGNDDTCFAASQTGPGTCNGNGDGEVKLGSTTGSYREYYHFFKQLANAGLIEGTFTGVGGAGGVNEQIPGQNVPAMRVSNAAFGLGNTTSIASGHASLFPGAYGLNAPIGGATATTVPSTPIFKPEEVWNIDTKLDDGNPAYGKINVNKKANLDNCATTNSETDAAYDLAHTGKSCWFRVRQLP